MTVDDVGYEAPALQSGAGPIGGLAVQDGGFQRAQVMVRRAVRIPGRAEAERLHAGNLAVRHPRGEAHIMGGIRGEGAGEMAELPRKAVVKEEHAHLAAVPSTPRVAIEPRRPGATSSRKIGRTTS